MEIIGDEDLAKEELKEDPSDEDDVDDDVADEMHEVRENAAIVHRSFSRSPRQLGSPASKHSRTTSWMSLPLTRITSI